MPRGGRGGGRRGAIAGGGLGDYLTPEPTGGSAGAQRLFGAGMGGGRGNSRTAIPQRQQAQQNAPPAYGTGKGATQSQKQNKAGPDFNSGGNPFEKFRSPQSGGQPQGSPAPSYGAGKGQGGKGMSPRTGTQRKALPNMQNKVAPMGGGNGQV